MKDAKNSKKMKVITKLNKKMDLIKQEMYNTTRYRRKCRNVIDFEKRQKTASYKHFIRPLVGSKGIVPPKERLKGFYEYLWDLRIMPLYKILKDSRKIVLYNEWVYFYQEIDFIPQGNEILKETKKRSFNINDGNGDGEKDNPCDGGGNPYDNIITPHHLLNQNIKQYFNRVSRILPEGFNLTLKNSPSVPIFIKRQKEETPPLKKLTSTEKYKSFLNSFSICSSSKSIFSKFTKVINGNNFHQSFMNCFKRIPPSRQECKGVKDLCLSYIPNTSPFVNEYEEIEEEEYPLNYLIPSKFKIESIDLYLKGIDPNAIINPPGPLFYPFEPSKLVDEENKNQNIIENNLYGNEKGDV
ncbi:hypothetical protein NBO_11g0037 [Nosema bombycis CQ1]|uniref:Uncharacterized protein n=1 Tax=Nosema bombycis (strain CQ1 / CVCC 102059) TaxID=578461 RepID=R0ML65_NOSB1|nr:hypothetical protein NBO_11g0037 [Nosema bombycis CQ1]|eukprot:EOB14965.1 hypothetical protein NBO_11g0037 [Nosema bombycis CQ1]